MTVEEKAAQFSSTAPAIPRLQVPAYNWWSEALHGVANQGTATVFPQTIGLAATFDEPLILKMATIISTEARAKFHELANANRRLPLLRSQPAGKRRGHPPRAGRSGFLVSQHQYFPRSALGPGPGNLRRGSLPHRTARHGLCPRLAGRRSEVLQGYLHAQALRRAQRPRTVAPHHRREDFPARRGRHLSAGVPAGHRGRQGGFGDVRL